MSRKLRVLLSSNHPKSPSGYSQQMAELVPLLSKEVELGIVSFFGQEGYIDEIDGVRYYPKHFHAYGSDALVEHAKDFNADLVLTLQDIWTLDMQHLKMTTRWTPILPIDHDPMPPAVYERAKLAYRIVSYSKFGHDELQRMGLHSTYIQHTVNTEIFKPMDKGVKAELRKQLGIPEDTFVFGIVAANRDNPPRKSFQELMDAFKMFREQVPNSLLYFHSPVNVNVGFQIQEYARFIGIEKNIMATEFYHQLYKVTKEEMAKLYNIFDVFVLPSTNEGFGVPLIEAGACGIPSITTNFTAMPELINNGEFGWLIDVRNKRFSPIGSYVGHPSTESLFEKMKESYKADRVMLGKKARKYIVDNYETKTIFETKWKPFLRLLEAEILKDE